MAVARSALRKWEAARAFALGMPGAGEEFPWGEAVAKVNKKVFVFMGAPGSGYPLRITVKLADETCHAHALTAPGAETAGYGLGRSGWVVVPLEPRGAPAADLLCDWVEESYRAIAPRRLIAELDAR